MPKCDGVHQHKACQHWTHACAQASTHCAKHQGCGCACLRTYSVLDLLVPELKMHVRHAPARKYVSTETIRTYSFQDLHTQCLTTLQVTRTIALTNTCVPPPILQYSEPHAPTYMHAPTPVRTHLWWCQCAAVATHRRAGLQLRLGQHRGHAHAHAQGRGRRRGCHRRKGGVAASRPLRHRCA